VLRPAERGFVVKNNRDQDYTPLHPSQEGNFFAKRDRSSGKISQWMFYRRLL